MYAKPPTFVPDFGRASDRTIVSNSPFIGLYTQKVYVGFQRLLHACSLFEACSLPLKPRRFTLHISVRYRFSRSAALTATAETRTWKAAYSAIERRCDGSEAES